MKFPAGSSVRVKLAIASWASALAWPVFNSKIFRESVLNKADGIIIGAGGAALGLGGGDWEWAVGAMLPAGCFKKYHKPLMMSAKIVKDKRPNSRIFLRSNSAVT